LRVEREELNVEITIATEKSEVSKVIWVKTESKYFNEYLNEGWRIVENLE
jgi:hypothetical protein